MPADDFATLLHGAGITLVIDIRAQPASRRNPHFGSAAMQRWLPERGVSYRWEPRLGGRRAADPASPHVALRHPAFRGFADHMGSAEFGAALDDVEADASGQATAIMCAESVWWRCHRRLVADATVLLRRHEVLHLFHDGRLTPHTPADSVRVEDGRLVYDVVAQPPLPGTEEDS